MRHPKAPYLSVPAATPRRVVPGELLALHALSARLAWVLEDPRAGLIGGDGASMTAFHHVAGFLKGVGDALAGLRRLAARSPQDAELVLMAHHADALPVVRQERMERPLTGWGLVRLAPGAWEVDYLALEYHLGARRAALRAGLAAFLADLLLPFLQAWLPRLGAPAAAA